ncbi:MAG: hypothetical protein HYR62_07220 [Actinobacteria bacterium]|nr:hypothetical protein [Actinomycetota bacterium]MBI3685966.1 hypothetical protein [Actinomycetota bacterium]
MSDRVQAGLSTRRKGTIMPPRYHPNDEPPTVAATTLSGATPEQLVQPEDDSETPATEPADPTAGEAPPS